MAESLGRLWVGTAGWSFEDWKGRVFPRTPPRGFQALEFMSRYFNAMEVNLSFYRVPDLRVVAGWVRQVAAVPEFRFVCKLHQRFTHQDEPWGAVQSREFLTALQPLAAAERLSGLLVQVPWSARWDARSRDRLARIADDFGAVPLVLEVRHESWNCPEARAWIAARRYSFCNIDQPLLPGCLAPSAHHTGPIGYVRLHGRNRAAWFAPDAGRDQRYDYYYRPDELAEWVPRVRTLLEQTANVFVVGNNHYRGQAAANALQLQAAVTATPVRVPPDLQRAYPELARIAAPDDARPPVQSTLFDDL